MNFDGSSWRQTRILLDGIPGYQLYNGGRIAIGLDGYLNATTGWVDGYRSQDLNSLAEKILRAGLDGSVPKYNPFNGSFVYSYGHRALQAFAWDTEARPSTAKPQHEINRITPGANYGWPIAQERC